MIKDDKQMEEKKKSHGYIVVTVLVFASVALTLLTGLSSWAALNYRLARTTVAREQAFQVAEAGIEYYRWHLAHAATDFYDGHASTTSPGPYFHPYYDKLGHQIGQFALRVNPPGIGSTIVTVTATGTVLADPTVSRTLQVKMGVPSLAKYAFVANAALRFGQGTEVFGPIHSNDGIRFDGIAHNLVTSAKVSYDDADHTGAVEFAVHTHLNPPPGSGSNDTFRSAEAPPATMPNRNDVFVAGRQFPVPAVDFNGLTQNLANLKTLAQNGGKYLTSSGRSGYNLILKNNGTYTVNKVTSLVNAPNGCSNDNNESGWGTWTVRNESLVGTYSYPANGIIFVEDDVWVEGQLKNNRLTIAAGRFPENSTTDANITFAKDIKYTYYDGRDVLALIAQGNVTAAMQSNSTIEVDGALVAKNGRIGRYHYGSGCSPYNSRAQITIFGMLASYLRYGFAFTDNTGYVIRNINYDGNLLYGPPPSFPLTSDQYQTISWREL